jgi:hypothetical protein
MSNKSDTGEKSKAARGGKKNSGTTTSEGVTAGAKGAAVPPELTEEEIRRQRINKASDAIEESGKYASAPAVQRKMREMFGEGMHQLFVHTELAARRQNAKLKPWLESVADCNDPLLPEIQRNAEHSIKTMAGLVQRARGDERRIAEASIKKAQQDASDEIARIELELNDYMEDNERLAADNERAAVEIKRLEALVTEKDALLIAQPKLSGFVEEKLDAIMAAFADKAVVAGAKSDADKPVAATAKPVATTAKPVAATAKPTRKDRK